MVHKQQIVDYAGRKTLPGTILLEIIFGEQFDWELLELWKANRLYLKPSSSKRKRSTANETLVNCIVARFDLHPSPNLAAPEEGLVNVEFGVHEFCVWFADRIKAIPNFMLSPSARLFVDAVLGTSKNKKTEIKKNNRHTESNTHRETVQKIAKKLWKEDKTLTITDITHENKINVITKSDGSNYSERTLRKWIKDLAPSNKPGRRPSKK